jgi:glycosyltransferase involved in cell wall biosynthesis
MKDDKLHSETGMPVCSIVFVLHNAQYEVEQRLTPFLSRALNAELIIIDDASEDGTDHAVTSLLDHHDYEATVYLRNDTRRGVALCLNEALLHASTPVLLVVDINLSIQIESLQRALGRLEESEAAFASAAGAAYGEPEKLRQLIYEQQIPASAAFLLHTERIPSDQLFFNPFITRGHSADLRLRTALNTSCIAVAPFVSVPGTDVEQGEMLLSLSSQEASIMSFHASQPTVAHEEDEDGEVSEEFPQVLFSRAVSLKLEGRITDALHLCDDILNKHPEHDETEELKIELLQRLKQFVGASELKHRRNMKLQGRRPDLPQAEPEPAETESEEPEVVETEAPAGQEQTEELEEGQEAEETAPEETETAVTQSDSETTATETALPDTERTEEQPEVSPEPEEEPVQEDEYKPEEEEPEEQEQPDKADIVRFPYHLFVQPPFMPPPEPKKEEDDDDDELIDPRFLPDTDFFDDDDELDLSQCTIIVPEQPFPVEEEDSEAIGHGQQELTGEDEAEAVEEDSAAAELAGEATEDEERPADPEPASEEQPPREADSEDIPEEETPEVEEDAESEPVQQPEEEEFRAEAEQDEETVAEQEQQQTSEKDHSDPPSDSETDGPERAEQAEPADQADVAAGTSDNTDESKAGDAEEFPVSGHQNGNGHEKTQESEEDAEPAGASPSPYKRPMNFYYTIVMPITAMALELLEKSLLSIEKHCDPDKTELIIVDNSCLDETHEYLKQLSAQRFFHLHVITNRKNRGFGRSVNQGIDKALGEYICILHNDVVVESDLLFELSEILNQDQRVGVVGPRTNSSTNPEQVAHADNDSLRTEETSYLDSFCLMLRAEDNYRFSDEYGQAWFEDVDLSYDIRQSGKRTVIAAGVFLPHYGGGTIGQLGLDEYSDVFQNNMAHFNKKWKIEPDMPDPDAAEHPLAEIYELGQMVNVFNPHEKHVKRIKELYTPDMEQALQKQKDLDDEVLIYFIRAMMVIDNRRSLRMLEEQLQEPLEEVHALELVRYYFDRHIYSRCRKHMANIKGTPGLWYILYKLRIAYGEKDLETVADMLNELIESYPAHPEINKIAGDMYQLMGDKEESESFYSLAHQIDPFNYAWPEED